MVDMQLAAELAVRKLEAAEERVRDLVNERDDLLERLAMSDKHRYRLMAQAEADKLEIDQLKAAADLKRERVDSGMEVDSLAERIYVRMAVSEPWDLESFGVCASAARSAARIFYGEGGE